jgi:addiction module HigA family antidote
MTNGGWYLNGRTATHLKLRLLITIEIKKMKKLNNVHPGEILKVDFLDEMNITPYALAKGIGVDQTRVSQLIKGKRSMSADTALRLGRFFNVSAEFWLNIQSRFDLQEEKDKNNDYEKIFPYQLN